LVVVHCAYLIDAENISLTLLSILLMFVNTLFVSEDPDTSNTDMQRKFKISCKKTRKIILFLKKNFTFMKICEETSVNIIYIYI